MKGKTLAAICLAVAGSASAKEMSVRVNQIGYASNAVKQAMVANPKGNTFTVLDAKTGNEVYRDSLSKSHNWKSAGEEIAWADFSKLKTPGNYVISVNGTASPAFTIEQKAEPLYRDALTWSIKAFYQWRSGMDLKEEYTTYKGVSYAREAGHKDNNVIVHKSLKNQSGGGYKTISTPGGWYDAGDYGKYVVNASITVHTLLTAYTMNPEYFDKLNLNIPESGNGTADILDEVMYELKWMLTMQDPKDGGVYNKVTTLDFPGMVQPSKDTRDRFVIGKTQDCAYDFAATMAMASRIFKDNKDYPDFSAKALSAAEKAYNYASGIKRYQMFQNPSDCNTGSYASSEVYDEKFWATCELLITTGNKKYADQYKLPNNVNVPFWGDVTTLGVESILLNKNAVQGLINIEDAEKKFRNLAEDLLGLHNTSIGRLPMRDFYWGSNGQVANSGMVLGIARKIFNSEKYLCPAQYCVDYLLGDNVTGYSFLTGFGTTYPKNLHDRRNSSNGIASPLPGYIVGGPSLDGTSDCGVSEYPSSRCPALAYVDRECSYSTNEVAINWNAPFVCLLSLVANAY